MCVCVLVWLMCFPCFGLPVCGLLAVPVLVSRVLRTISGTLAYAALELLDIMAVRGSKYKAKHTHDLESWVFTVYARLKQQKRRLLNAADITNHSGIKAIWQSWIDNCDPLARAVEAARRADLQGIVDSLAPMVGEKEPQSLGCSALHPAKKAKTQ